MVVADIVRARAYVSANSELDRVSVISQPIKSNAPHKSKVTNGRPNIVSMDMLKRVSKQ